MGSECRIRDNGTFTTENSNKLAKFLIESDIPRSVAFTLVYIRNKGEITSVEIERETGLRQPEVSIRYMKDGMNIGLGTGSTVNVLLETIDEMKGRINYVGKTTMEIEVDVFGRTGLSQRKMEI